MLTAAEVERYNRQLVLPELGLEGQGRIQNARVLVVGAGGLGSPAALYLAAAGVGTLGIADSDRVELSNLHRQILHGTQDVGRLKTKSAESRLRLLNDHVDVRVHPQRLDERSARDLLADYDLVVDGSDNYATRYAINDGCAHLGIPWVYGSVERFSGQVSVFGASDGPCYRCIFAEPPRPGSTASCEEIGVLGAIPGVIGALQATEALKLICGIGAPLVGRMLQMDFLNGHTSWIRFDKRPDCAACGVFRREMTKTTQADEALPFDAEPREIHSRLGENALQLLDVREPWEVARASIAGALTVPLNELENRVATLDRAAELVVFCHHGSRSRVAAEWLRSLGYNARNLVGGIDRWSAEVDSTVRRY